MALTYLETQSQQFPEIALKLGQCIDAYRSKLWHQLTDYVSEILQTNPDGFDWLQFEEKFIREFRKYVNPQRFAQIIIQISKYSNKSDEGISLCTEAMEATDDTNAKFLLRCQIAFFQLQIDPKSAKEALEGIESDINKQIRVAPATVHARYHFVCSHLWKSYGDSEKFYRNAMSYLGYSDMDDIDNPSQWANDVALAALAAPSFYDFGELSLHPVMETLENTDRLWVLEVVRAYIVADLEAYHQVFSKHEKNIASEPILSDKLNILDEKIRLLALVRLAFYKPSAERILTFDEISQVTKCPPEQVEKLVMRSMSLKLMRGIVDEITKSVMVSWVKPRILDRDEIGAMSKRMESWVDKIDTISADIEPAINNLFK